ncbi:MAG TPA: AfsR/SARP family transcriptional regulator [Candidatus Dormibacteraeota bacterium]
MEYRILGPVAVVGPDGPLALGGPKQRALLGILVLAAGSAVSVDRLVAALWDQPPETAVNILQGHVRDLRRLLGRDALVTQAPGYLLQADPMQIDAHQFEQGACEARRLLTSDPATAALRLRDALALWRGPVLADVVYPSVPAEITRLDELRIATLEDRVDADLALGAHADLAGELGALLADHPGRERLSGQLMLALYRAGRQEEALTAYRELHRRLREELGISPSPELQRLERSILRQEPSLLLPSPGGEPPPPGTATAPPPRTPPAAPLLAPRRWPPRARLLATAALLVAGVSSVGVLRARTGTPPPAPSPCLHATPLPEPRELGPGLGVAAVVAHSCDANSQGVWPRGGPARDAPRIPPALGETTPIRIVCQDLHGGLVIDNKLQAAPQPSSTVWDRLDDGTWVPDLYTSLPKRPGQVPPLGLPVC